MWHLWLLTVLVVCDLCVDFGLGDAVSLLGFLPLHGRSRALRSARSQYVTSNQHGGQGDFGIALWDFRTFNLNCLCFFWSFSHAELAGTGMPRRAVSDAGDCETGASPGLAAAWLAFDKTSTSSCRDKAKLLSEYLCCRDKLPDTSRSCAFT